MKIERIDKRGPRIHFRPLVKADAAGPYLEWINDERVKRHLAARYDRLHVEDLEKYIEDVNASPTEIMLAICSNEDGRHIGNIKLQRLDFTHGTASVSIVIGEVPQWDQGLGTEAIALVTEYAFRDLNLKRLDAGCFEANKRAVKAFLKCGFIKEGVTRDSYELDGRRWNMIRMGILVTDPPFWKDINQT